MDRTETDGVAAAGPETMPRKWARPEGSRGRGVD